MSAAQHPAPHPAHHEVAELRRRLLLVGQDHVLNFLDRLGGVERHALLAQIAALDIEGLPRLVDEYVKAKPAFTLPADVRPAPYFTTSPSSGSAATGDSPARGFDVPGMRRAGEDLLRAGKVAAFVVAGGQGSRLGFEGPKGCFPAGAVTGKTLFQIFAEQLRAAERTFSKPIPWYVMTSPLNHDATASFFERHAFFGLDRANVRFFQQGVMPTLDIRTGKILLASPGELATNPDGHGGAVKALAVSGALDDMKRRGVEHLSYFQVDNPHVKITDPVFIGLHAAGPGSSAEMSSKMIPKAYPDEKLGVFCQAEGKTTVIEYSDLPAALQAERLADGTLRFLAGSIAIHMISVEFLHRLSHDPAFRLPYHRAEKKVPCIDPATGAAIIATANNGVKLERFIFDALDFCKGSIVYQTDRVEEFAPIKNATGVDSIESSKALQTERAARWLEAAGTRIPRRADGTPACTLELSPLTALEPDDLKAWAKRPASIEQGAKVVM